MRRRIQLGEKMRVVTETPDGLQLESAARLRPGQIVEFVSDAARPTGEVARGACVISWSVVRLGKDGPVYHGLCRWQ